MAAVLTEAVHRLVPELVNLKINWFVLVKDAVQAPLGLVQVEPLNEQLKLPEVLRIVVRAIIGGGLGGSGLGGCGGGLGGGGDWSVTVVYSKKQQGFASEFLHINRLASLFVHVMVQLPPSFPGPVPVQPEHVVVSVDFIKPDPEFGAPLFPKSFAITVMERKGRVRFP